MHRLDCVWLTWLRRRMWTRPWDSLRCLNSLCTMRSTQEGINITTCNTRSNLRANNYEVHTTMYSSNVCAYLPGACVPLMLSTVSFVRWLTRTLYALMRHVRGSWPRDTDQTSLTSVWTSTRDSMFGTLTNHVPGSPSSELYSTGLSHYWTLVYIVPPSHDYCTFIFTLSWKLPWLVLVGKKNWLISSKLQ